MTKMFRGDTIPGLVQAVQHVLPRPGMPPVEFDDLVAAVGLAGLEGQNVRDHIAWLVVNDPRVVRNGKRIRRYTGPTDDDPEPATA